MKKFLLLLFALPFAAVAQEDMLAGIDSTATKEKVESAFKGLKIVNIESTKLAAKGDLYFIVAHRFGSIKEDFEGFYGLDQAITELKFVYGLTDWLTVSAARSELAYDFSGKFALLPQRKDGFPINVTGFVSVAFNNTLKESAYPKMNFNDRIIYTSQLLISRKCSEKLSLEIAPTFFHENFVDIEEQDNSQFALGMGGRYKFARRWSVNVDWAPHLNRATDSPYHNPFSVGVDLDTGGHVFQMHFTNAQAMHEAGYLGHATGDWADGNIFFGFNLLRVF